MTSPMQLILQGVQQQAEARLVAEQEAKAITEAEATSTGEAGAVETEAIEAITVLSKAVMELTNGGAK